MSIDNNIGGQTVPLNAVLGNISGVKYNDFNRDGLRDALEPGLPGITIYLDQNNNGQLDPDELSSISG
ncbi:MAG: hypothetical protein O4861_02485, partial [Trichodesmium sp. St16_bin4-tuft]|nr:hypothetical protein [Trichodesmium sp. St16_bin4-tuft]